jgi:hypothetical protein
VTQNYSIFFASKFLLGPPVVYKNRKGIPSEISEAKNIE